MRSKQEHAKYMRNYNLNPIHREKKRIRDRKYGRLHKEKAVERATEWAKNHKEHRKEYLKKYYQNTKETRRDKKNVYERKYSIFKWNNDLNYKLKKILRKSIRNYLKRKMTKNGSFVKDLGCTILELKIYLEKQFTDGMTWENHGFRGWHIDHKKPLSKFDLTDRKQFLEACHYTNLQPLWWRENIIKSNR